MLFISNAANTVKEGIFYDEFFITTFPSKVQWIRHEEDRKKYFALCLRRVHGDVSHLLSPLSEITPPVCVDDLFSPSKHTSPRKKSRGKFRVEQKLIFIELGPVKSVNTRESLNFFLFLESCPVLSFTLSRNLQSRVDRYVNNRAVLSHEVHNTSDEKTSEFSRFAYTHSICIARFLRLDEKFYFRVHGRNAPITHRCCACSFPLPCICFTVLRPLTGDVGHSRNSTAPV